VRLAGEDPLQSRGDVLVVVEAEHRIGLRQRVGQLLAVPLREAAHRHHRLGPAALLEVRRREQGVDRVLLRSLDEATGVDQRHVGVTGLGDEQPAVGGETAGELLGVDLVTAAAEGDQRDAPARRGGGHGPQPIRARRRLSPQPDPRA
jgi:hypothetical protein